MSANIVTVAVDLTPLLPGGDNGGAKIFVLELLRCLAVLDPQYHFVLLTRAASHDELRSLDCRNVERLLVLGAVDVPMRDTPWARVVRRLLPYLSGGMRTLVGRFGYEINRYKKRLGSDDFLHQIGADLLFCPFTAPSFAMPGIPTVCTLYDLQYQAYPEFFATEDVLHRDRVFKDVCRCVSLIAAISDYSRNSAIRHGNIDPARIRTIHLRMAKRFGQNAKNGENLLRTLGLVHGHYLIYPANFWRHKNHEMLLTAFGMALRSGLPQGVKLVCTGAPGERQAFLMVAVAALGLQGRILFPGFVADDDLAILLKRSRGMIFPSLYEGFGMPVLEAMANGIPVACSNLTSLPELAADAAILFDPKVPTEIAAAVVQLICGDETARTQMINAGRRRAEEFADVDRMGAEYLTLFRDALSMESKESELSGVFPDGWLGAETSLRVASSDGARSVEIEVLVPDWLPHARVVLRISDFGGRVRRFRVRRGGRSNLSIPLKTTTANFRIEASPCFVPSRIGRGDDSRELALMLMRCVIQCRDGKTIGLFPHRNSR